MTASGPVTTTSVRIDFFGESETVPGKAQMGHPEEGIEGRETVAEARAEKLGGRGGAPPPRPPTAGDATPPTPPTPTAVALEFMAADKAAVPAELRK